MLDKTFKMSKKTLPHFLAHLCILHGGLICISFCLSVCLSGFTQATLYTTTTVYGVLVHQEGAICTMVHKGDYVFLKIQGTLMI